MRRIYPVICALAFSAVIAQAQNKNPKSQPAPHPTPQTQQQTTQQQPRPQAFDLSEVGVQVLPEPRLIVIMAALDAAGFDPTPEGEDLPVFRAQVRKDQANLDPDLKKRLSAFFERNKLREGGKELPPAQQAARYVSLAYALGSAPGFEAPLRTDDLPAGLLEVLDFAPLVREFYHKSGIEERLPGYLRMYQAEGERFRRPTVEMVRSVLLYLNTRPITSTIERIPVKAPTTGGKKRDVPMTFTTREHTRRFIIVPDLLAAPGSINFRVIADDYFVTVPYCDETRHYCPGRDNNPSSPELRRAYIQYVIDPLVIRFNREILARKEQIKQLLDARTAAGAEVSPDIILTVARSLTAATDARLEETLRLNAMTSEARNRLDKTADATQRAEITKSLEAARSTLADEVTAQLAESYESGAVLDFYFAEQLRGIESSGFDIGNSLADMITSFDPAREAKRLEEADAARKRALAARKARERQGEANAAIAALPNAALVRQLLEVEQMVRLKNYAAAEERLLSLLRQSPDEPRIYFALGETANLSALEITDDDLQNKRLDKALVHYRNAIRVATPDTDRCLLARSHEAMGRILGFQDKKDESLKEFDAVIQSGDTTCDAYSKAVAGKKKLLEP
jgi:tetratricopeptide (TPR) repeat protein